MENPHFICLLWDPNFTFIFLGRWGGGGGYQSYLFDRLHAWFICQGAFTIHKVGTAVLSGGGLGGAGGGSSGGGGGGGDPDLTVDPCEALSTLTEVTVYSVHTHPTVSTGRAPTVVHVLMTVLAFVSYRRENNHYKKKCINHATYSGSSLVLQCVHIDVMETSPNAFVKQNERDNKDKYQSIRLFLL